MSEFGFQTSGVPQPGLEDLEFRPYRSGDEHAILKTFNRVFRETNGPCFVDRKLDEWRWIYAQNPAGTRVFLAMAPDGTVAGQWAGIPVRVRTAFGTRVFVQIVDTLVHPDYRKGRHEGPGVFALVGSQGIQHWMNGFGDAALYGYPVPMAEKMGRRFLGYRRLCVVDFLVRPLEAPEPARRLPSGWALERWDRAHSDLDDLFERAAEGARCLLVRDASAWQWRYFERPGAPYEMHAIRENGTLRGAIVLRPEHELVPGACGIADWLVPKADPQVAAALLSVAAERGRYAGRSCLMAVFPEASAECALLREAGFELIPSAQQMERRLTYWTGPDAPEISDAYLNDQWWFTLGDSDLI